MVRSILVRLMRKMNAFVDVTCRLPKKKRDTIQVTFKKVSGIRLEVPGKAVRLIDMGMRTCRIPARIVDLWPTTFLIDVPCILVQLGKGTDV